MLLTEDTIMHSRFTKSWSVVEEVFPPLKVAMQLISEPSSVSSGRKVRMDSISQEPLPLSLWIWKTPVSRWARLQVRWGQWSGQVWVTEQEMVYGSPWTAFLRELSLGLGGSAVKEEGKRKS